MKSMSPLAILEGVRTPFGKAFGALSEVSAVSLGREVSAAAIRRAQLTPDQIDEVILGNVAGPPDATNIARVIALRVGVPSDRIAHTVNRNCASGMESIVQAWQAIESGRSQIVLAGGTESMSGIPFFVNDRGKRWLSELGKAKSAWQKLKLIGRLRPGFLKPVIGVQMGLTDPVCGLNMGQTAELLAREFTISRESQDQFALQSHQRTLAAQESGFLSGEVEPLACEGVTLDRDNGPRPGQSLEQLARLRPIFDPEGSVTAGNSCPLTDGAAAVVVTSVEHARRMGQKPLGYLTAYAVAGCQPERMGLGPVYATAKLLEQTGQSLDTFDLFEMNEAFAAQVLACLNAFESPRFARSELHRDAPLGTIPRDKLNIHGGAIAMGHPVGTTGTRLILTLLRALRDRGERRGLATLCVGGGQGMAVTVETELEL